MARAARIGVRKRAGLLAKNILYTLTTRRQQRSYKNIETLKMVENVVEKCSGVGCEMEKRFAEADEGSMLGFYIVYVELGLWVE